MCIRVKRGIKYGRDHRQFVKVPSGLIWEWSALILGHKTGENLNESCFDTYRSMSIKSGQLYTMRNEENGMALDLYHSNNDAIIGHRFHSGETQQVRAFAILMACPSYNHDIFQWITEKQDDGQWTIQS